MSMRKLSVLWAVLGLCGAFAGCGDVSVGEGEEGNVGEGECSPECVDNQYCDGGECKDIPVITVEATCEVGTVICKNGVPHKCNEEGEYDKLEECGDDEYCNDGECTAKPVNDKCEVGSKTCIEGVPNLCNADGVFKPQAACEENEYCENGECLSKPVITKCEPGLSKCVDNKFYKCNETGGWDEPKECNEDLCTLSGCKERLCKEGESHCIVNGDSEARAICSNGDFIIENCADDNLYCVERDSGTECTKCKPGSTRCIEDGTSSIEICNDKGEWSTATCYEHNETKVCNKTLNECVSCLDDSHCQNNEDGKNYCNNWVCEVCPEGQEYLDSENGCVSLCNENLIANQLHVGVEQLHVIKDLVSMNEWRNSHESKTHLVFCGEIVINSEFSSLPVTTALKIIGVNNATITSVANNNIPTSIFNDLDNVQLSNLTLQNIRFESEFLHGSLASEAKNVIINNLVLDNITIVSNKVGTNVGGLFGSGTNIEVNDVKIDGVTVEALQADNVGGLYGVLQADEENQSTIHYQYSDKLIFKTIAGKNKVGGLIGTVYGKFIFNKEDSSTISIENKLVEGKNYVGGFIGNVQCSEFNVQNVNNTINEVNGNSVVGGFIGYAHDLNNNSIITKISNIVSGSVNASGSFVGGFAGVIDGKNHILSIKSVSNDVISVNTDRNRAEYVGGFVGGLNGPQDISAIHNKVGNVFAKQYAGGFAAFIGCHNANIEYSCDEHHGSNSVIHDILNEVNVVNSSQNTSGGFIGKMYLSPDHVSTSIEKIISSVQEVSANSWVGGFISTVYLRKAAENLHSFNNIYSSSKIGVNESATESDFGAASSSGFIDRLLGLNDNNNKIIEFDNIIVNASNTDTSNLNLAAIYFDLIQTKQYSYYCEENIGDMFASSNSCYSGNSCNWNGITNTCTRWKSTGKIARCAILNDCVIYNVLSLNKAYNMKLDDVNAFRDRVCGDKLTDNRVCIRYSWDGNNSNPYDHSIFDYTDSPATKCEQVNWRYNDNYYYCSDGYQAYSSLFNTLPVDISDSIPSEFDLSLWELCSKYIGMPNLPCPIITLD